MCLYPKLILNKKYVPNRKNNHRPPKCTDERCKYVPVGCGQCIECRKQKAQAWRVRLTEELKENPHAKFVTLTFSPECLKELIKEKKIDESNAIAGIAIRRFLERIRKETKKSIHHWLITELGDEHSERIHIHGIIWTDQENEWIEKKWKYGHIWVGDYVNQMTINYIIKYVTKIDEKHKGFVGQIFTSPGIGKNYFNSYNFEKNKYIPNKTNETYRLPNGRKINLPIYYRNKRYSEAEREKLWIEKLDKETRYILGNPISVKEDNEQYFEILKNAQALNTRLGYGNDSKDWQKKSYNVTLNMLRKKKLDADYKANNADWQNYLKKRLKNLEKQNK